jgi:hypothetical protein
MGHVLSIWQLGCVKPCETPSLEGVHAVESSDGVERTCKPHPVITQRQVTAASCHVLDSESQLILWGWPSPPFKWRPHWLGVTLDVRDRPMAPQLAPEDCGRVTTGCTGRCTRILGSFYSTITWIFQC